MVNIIKKKKKQLNTCLSTPHPAPTTDTDMSAFASSCDSNDTDIKDVSELGMEPTAREGKERRLKAA